MTDEYETRVLNMNEIKKLVNFDLIKFIGKFSMENGLSDIAVDVTLTGIIGASLAVKSPDFE